MKPRDEFAVIAALWPTARFVARQTFSWGHLLPALLGAALVYIVGSEFAALTAIAAQFCLIFAVPIAAARLIELDRTGQLDFLRLSGQPASRLLLGLLLGIALPWLLSGMALLAWQLRAVSVGIDQVLGVAAILGASWSLSLLALALPRFEGDADTRIIAIGLACLALLGSVLQYQLLGLTTDDGGIVGFRPAGGWSAVILGVEAGLSALALPRVLQIFERPRPRLHRRVLRLPVAGIAQRAPRFYRGVVLAIFPATIVGVLSLLTVAALHVLITGNRAEPALAAVEALALFPLAAGGFAISSTARSDVDSGRLALMRLAPTSDVWSVFAMTLGSWLPFVIASLLLVPVVRSLWGTGALSVSAIVIVVVATAPVALAEGWLRRWPFLYLAPATLAIARLVSLRDPSIPDLVAVGLFAILAWLATVRLFRVPDRSPLSGWAGIITIGFFAIAVLWIDVGLLGLANSAATLCALLLLTSALTVNGRSRRVVDTAGPVISGFLTTMVMAVMIGMQWRDGVILGAATAAAWWGGRRIHLMTRNPVVSAAIRVFAAILLITSVAYIWIGGNVARPNLRDATAVAGYRTRTHARFAAVVVGSVAILELLHHLTQYARRATQRP